MSALKCNRLRWHNPLFLAAKLLFMAAIALPPAGNASQADTLETNVVEVEPVAGQVDALETNVVEVESVVEQTDGIGTNTADIEPAPEPEPVVRRIDRYHAGVSDKVWRYVRSFDEYLAGRNIPDKPTGSWVWLIPKVEVEDAKGMKIGATFKSRIVLPHLPERLELIADNLPRGILPGKDVAPDTQDSVNAGVRWKMLRRDLSWIDVDGGVNLNPWPSPFARLNMSHVFLFSDVLSLELSQQGFLYVNDDGFGEMTELILTRVLKPGCYTRMVTAATWSEITEGVEWEQTGKMVWSLGRHRTLEPCLSFFGHVDSASLMDNYRLNVTYRWNAFRPWLFFSVTPQISFPRERDYQITPMLRFCAEIIWHDS
ncbi:MAG: hypothetical protein ACOYCD_08265 [Kiritimatiellia bacterium]